MQNSQKYYALTRYYIMILCSKHPHVKKIQQIIILLLTKNSDEIFRDYLNGETIKKVPQKTNPHKISQIFHWNGLFTNFLMKGNNHHIRGARLYLRSAPIFTKKERHGKRAITFDSPHILAYLESDIKNFSTKLQYFIKFTCLKIEELTQQIIG